MDAPAVYPCWQESGSRSAACFPRPPEQPAGCHESGHSSCEWVRQGHGWTAMADSVKPARTTRRGGICNALEANAKAFLTALPETPHGWANRCTNARLTPMSL
ncbi:unnamed protein product [Vitrella brassicaformis CCMP3155]|uniref:Uncharacterized protein n=1 Tax=Vitrella brassicaformis (strain CCMP3155) TaxID=1169540 RepID=A0A0G4EP31_VITBC|nr:unnamed protein product [Vitrella brassicaformis CCMP3155]|eukprot:CEL99211.1 unnamed protein product [Vitrella brassicaformis CCMP3155]